MALAARMIPSLPYKLDRIIDFGLFVVMAIREAIKENVLHASVPHAPYVSTAMWIDRFVVISNRFKKKMTTGWLDYN